MKKLLYFIMSFTVCMFCFGTNVEAASGHDFYRSYIENFVKSTSVYEDEFNEGGYILYRPHYYFDINYDSVVDVGDAQIFLIDYTAYLAATGNGETEELHRIVMNEVERRGNFDGGCLNKYLSYAYPYNSLEVAQLILQYYASVLAGTDTRYMVYYSLGGKLYLREEIQGWAYDYRDPIVEFVHLKFDQWVKYKVHGK